MYNMYNIVCVIFIRLSRYMRLLGAYMRHFGVYMRHLANIHIRFCTHIYYIHDICMCTFFVYIYYIHI